jgi:hypothetical protein
MWRSILWEGGWWNIQQESLKPASLYHHFAFFFLPLSFMFLRV